VTRREEKRRRNGGPDHLFSRSRKGTLLSTAQVAGWTERRPRGGNRNRQPEGRKDAPSSGIGVVQEKKNGRSRWYRLGKGSKVQYCFVESPKHQKRCFRGGSLLSGRAHSIKLAGKIDSTSHGLRTIRGREKRATVSYAAISQEDAKRDRGSNASGERRGEKRGKSDSSPTTGEKRGERGLLLWKGGSGCAELEEGSPEGKKEGRRKKKRPRADVTKPVLKRRKERGDSFPVHCRPKRDRPRSACGRGS